MTETQTTDIQQYLKDEQTKLNTNSSNNKERLPALKLETGKITKFSIIVEKPFEEWIDAEKGVRKKIIQVIHNGEKKNLWLNEKNPLYKQLVDKLITGQKDFYISTTGSQTQTRYEIQQFD